MQTKRSASAERRFIPHRYPLASAESISLHSRMGAGGYCVLWVIPKDVDKVNSEGLSSTYSPGVGTGFTEDSASGSDPLSD